MPLRYPQTVFVLQELVSNYVYLMAPLVKVKRTIIVDGSPVIVNAWVRITERYENVLNLCNSESNLAKKHKKELFGTDKEMIFSDLYNLASIAKELNIPYHDFNKIPMHERAIMIAQFYISNMLDTLRRHDDIIERNVEKQASKK